MYLIELLRLSIAWPLFYIGAAIASIVCLPSLFLYGAFKWLFRGVIFHDKDEIKVITKPEEKDECHC